LHHGARIAGGLEGPCGKASALQHEGRVRLVSPTRGLKRGS
jgi:hypothetical protein